MKRRWRGEWVRRVSRRWLEAIGAADARPRTPVALVGAGPGCADLITLRGLRCLQEAEIVFYDRLVDPALLDHAPRRAERIYVGKAPGCHSWTQDRINAALVAEALKGKRVVRLKCGDPGVFARGAEEAEALAAAGIAVRIVPGVTAASAAAAATGLFLTERGRNDSLILATAHKADASTPPHWADHLNTGACVALYMGVAKAGEIVEVLRRAGLADRTEVRIVSRAETPQQMAMTCRAPDLVQTIKMHGISNPAILFLRLHESYVWRAGTSPAVRVAMPSAVAIPQVLHRDSALAVDRSSIPFEFVSESG